MVKSAPHLHSSLPEPTYSVANSNRNDANRNDDDDDAATIDTTAASPSAQQPTSSATPLPPSTGGHLPLRLLRFIFFVGLTAFAVTVAFAWLPPSVSRGATTTDKRTMIVVNVLAHALIVARLWIARDVDTLHSVNDMVMALMLFNFVWHSWTVLAATRQLAAAAAAAMTTAAATAKTAGLEASRWRTDCM